MHDPQALLRAGEQAVAALARRRFNLDLAALGEMVSNRKDLGIELDKLRAEAKQAAKDGAAGGPGQGPRERARQLKERIQRLEAAHKSAELALTEVLLKIPNLPDADAPDGVCDQDAVEVRRVGEPTVADFALRHHAELSERAGLIDLPRAAKLSGSRFSVSRGAGALLHRALAAFFLDLHTVEQGYVEYAVPTLVTRETMTGTGQLPKFEEDLFRTEVAGRELFLIPTAEVPLVNLFSADTVPTAGLPIAVTAHTPCFRSEAGSYGRDTRGVFRLHEFSKVELVRICRQQESRAQLELLVGHAEECLRRLELSY